MSLVPKTTWTGTDNRRSIEKRINNFANYTADIEHNGNTHTVHFMGLFSEKKDAQSMIMTHGWPGESFLQYLRPS
jgi:microsomal epoxide hydrolase